MALQLNIAPPFVVLNRTEAEEFARKRVEVSTSRLRIPNTASVERIVRAPARRDGRVSVRGITDYMKQTARTLIIKEILPLSPTRLPYPSPRPSLCSFHYLLPSQYLSPSLDAPLRQVVSCLFPHLGAVFLEGITSPLRPLQETDSTSGQAVFLRFFPDNECNSHSITIPKIAASLTDPSGEGPSTSRSLRNVSGQRREFLPSQNCTLPI